MIYHLKYNFLFLLLCFASLFYSERAQANHAVGAELTYECLGSNQYRLRYAFYRDCSSTAAPSSVPINYSSACFSGGSINLIPVAGTPTQISTVCPSLNSSCNGGTYTGIEEWIYTGVVTLPGLCSDWLFSYGLCCRNGGITTVSNPTTYQLFVFALLNNVDGICNNSPRFNNRPFIYACIGETVCFDNGVSDVDGDSVRYQIITPLAAAGNSIIYDFPYSNSQPVSSSPPVMFNPADGSFCMKPTASEVSPYGLLVSEYRDGILIGQVERDIQIETRACTNASPSLTGINGTPIKSMNICSNIPTEFYILSDDNDSMDQTTISWNDGIPGAQFISWGGMHDSATFAWTPSVGDALSNPHCFSATVNDDHCPYINQSSANYCMYVLDSTDSRCLTSSIPEQRKKSDVRAFRVDNKYMLEWTGKNVYSNCRVYDSTGRIIYDHEIDGMNTEIDIAGFRGGLYLICLNGLDNWCKSFVKE